ncbi:Uncharacterised protein [Streptococcus australis]|uniref:Uncharacterized protein n=1 Tax=Streptococcus viridans TaxID=78535 RepID=A0A3S4PWL7_9STRE|nr:Uncharacterised protein [Streptococcus viridans]VEE18840.1 Uncharacterised protein [Streptococcus australis]
MRKGEAPNKDVKFLIGAPSFSRKILKNDYKETLSFPSYTNTIIKDLLTLNDKTPKTFS